MVRKNFLLTFLFLFVILSNSFGVKGNVFYIKDSLLIINDKLKIDLLKPLDEVLNKIDVEYETEFLPGHKGFYFNKYPITINFNTQTNHIDSVVFDFYFSDSKDDVLIEELIVHNIKLTNDINMEMFVKLLENYKLKYKMRELTEYYNFIINDHQLLAVEYAKDKMSIPLSVEVVIQKK